MQVYDEFIEGPLDDLPYTFMKTIDNDDYNDDRKDKINTDKKLSEGIKYDFSNESIPRIITKDLILSIVSEEDIFRHYLGDKFRLNRPICSPLRNDKNPSFNVYLNKAGSMLWIDFAEGSGGDCFTLVQSLLGMNFKSTLKAIYNDVIGVNKSKTVMSTLPKQPSLELALSKTLPESNRLTKIKVVTQPYTEIDKHYWGQYGLTIHDLFLHDVLSVKEAWIGEAIWPTTYKDISPMYAFGIMNQMTQAKRYKIYRPYERRDTKWRSNCDAWDMLGWDQLPVKGNLCIITKSLKDVMVLKKMGFNAVAPQSESCNIPGTLATRLKERFKLNVLLFDDDPTGRKNSLRLADQHGWKVMSIVGKPAKDISDMVLYENMADATSFMFNKLRQVLDVSLTDNWLTYKTGEINKN